jgi:2-dehydropantoate 2-reductase
VPEPAWPQIAVLGAGAVGCYFGGMLARAGAPVTFIGRPAFVAAAADGLVLDTLKFQERVRVRASADVSNVRQAAIVLLAVKTLDTETAAKQLAPHLAPGATLISLQNGVDNVERIRTATGLEAIATVVYVAAAMSAPAHVKHSGRGDLVAGLFPQGGPETGARWQRLHELADIFQRAEVPCRVSANIQAELWTKLIMNCAYNAISALSLARYGRVLQNAGTRDLMRRVTEEALAVARAAGVELPAPQMVESVYKLGEAMPQALSSTAQDLARGKRTEMDSLNGYLVRRGQELGVNVPVNQTLYSLMKLREDSLEGN